jgi:hypothetical protein
VNPPDTAVLETLSVVPLEVFTQAVWLVLRTVGVEAWTATGKTANMRANRRRRGGIIDLLIFLAPQEYGYGR